MGNEVSSIGTLDEFKAENDRLREAAKLVKEEEFKARKEAKAARRAAKEAEAEGAFSSFTNPVQSSIASRPRVEETSGPVVSAELSPSPPAALLRSSKGNSKPLRIVDDSSDDEEDILKGWQARKTARVKNTVPVLPPAANPSNGTVSMREGERSRSKEGSEIRSRQSSLLSTRKATPPTAPPSRSAVAPARSKETTPDVVSKRPVPSAYADDRRAVSDKRRRTSHDDNHASGSRRSSIVAAAPDQTTAFGPPEWYKRLSKSTVRSKDNSNQDILLQALKTAIRKFQETRNNEQAALVRVKLHHLVFEPVTGQLLRNHTMLHEETGLPQIFRAPRNGWPWDIKADAEELYNKWCRQDFGTDLFRGTIHGAKMDSLDPKFRRVPADYHGNGDLINGQWWPTQLTALRDGAHGATVAGIHGKEGDGAYSCIMSGGGDYPDEDHGDTVLYCGTDSTTGRPSEYTSHMLESERNGTPVRLLRSHNLRSQYAPQYGFRYDGLYDVVSHEVMDSNKQRHRFRLVRQKDQDPLRGTEPAKRPTQREVDELLKDRANWGKK